MSNKIIIYATLTFLLVSFVFLSAVEMKQADPNTKNIWMLYFIDPKSASLDFMIDNHSAQTDFHFEILADKTRVGEGDISIPNGATKTVPITISDSANKKIVIDVTAGNAKKEIYKNF